MSWFRSALAALAVAAIANVAEAGCPGGAMTRAAGGAVMQVWVNYGPSGAFPTRLIWSSSDPEYPEPDVNVALSFRPSPAGVGSATALTLSLRGGLRSASGAPIDIVMSLNGREVWRTDYAALTQVPGAPPPPPNAKSYSYVVIATSGSGRPAKNPAMLVDVMRARGLAVAIRAADGQVLAKTEAPLPAGEDGWSALYRAAYRHAVEVTGSATACVPPPPPMVVPQSR